MAGSTTSHEFQVLSTEEHVPVARRGTRKVGRCLKPR